MQNTDVTLLNICGVVDRHGIARVNVNLLLGEFVLSSLELDKLFAIDDRAST